MLFDDILQAFFLSTSASLQSYMFCLKYWLQVTYSIDGCIRSFKMTESPVDLDNPTSSFNVGKCFVTAQKGTYFDGTGFAKTGNEQQFC